MKPFFITGSGTGIGKTLLTTALCWQLHSQGKKITALKPVITGYDANNQANDTALILRSLGLSAQPKLMEAISPWRYAAPLSPNMAAAGEKRPIDTEALVAFCREHASLKTDIVLAEGAGGVMTPITDSFTMRDLMLALRWPVLLVGGSYLGAISHTLTAFEALTACGLAVKAVVISASPQKDVPLDDTAATIEKFVPDTIPVVKVPRMPEKEELWKHVPSLHWICE